MPAYEVILPTDPERAARVNATPGVRRRFWQRRRWLPAFDTDALLTLIEEVAPGDRLWIKPVDDVPGGAALRVEDEGVRRTYYVFIDVTRSPAEISKGLYHELEHVRQSRMFPSGDAFHTAAHWAAIEGILSGLGSWYEERAQTAEGNHYDRPLARCVREAR